MNEDPQAIGVEKNDEEKTAAIGTGQWILTGARIHPVERLRDAKTFVESTNGISRRSNHITKQGAAGV